jgi:general secretion pathway protein G
MQRRSAKDAATQERGDMVKVVQLTGHRVVVSGKESASSYGFTLIELVISITVLTILTLGIVPLVKLSVKRQKEQRLRETLRSVRAAIDEFHRDTVGMVCSGVPGGPPGPPPPPDPRSRVVISDCTIFGIDNQDRFPPTLETLVEGVNVIPRQPVMTGGLPLSQQTSTKKKVYLRSIPVDPMTGKNEWDFRSCYDAADTESWGGENVFDLRSKSKGIALNGEKYSDW